MYLYFNILHKTRSKEGNDKPLQCSCLENSMDRAAWWATVPGVKTVGHDWLTLSHFTKKHVRI